MAAASNKRRRLLVLGAGWLALGPLMARAQHAGIPVIGFLSGRSPGEAEYVVTAFRQGLKEAGYIEGQNVLVEYRWAEGRYDRLKPLAAELVARKVALIAATGGVASGLAAKSSTSTIPIVFTAGGDPVKMGLVASLNRPGGNVTGANLLTAELETKRLELLRELVPAANKIAVLVNPKSPTAKGVTKEIEAAARVLGRQVHLLTASTEEQIEAAFASLRQSGSEALLVTTDPFFDTTRDQLIVLPARHSLPTIYGWREYPLAGGLMSYGTSVTDGYRQAGLYAGRILKGAKPADMPVQAAKVELVINRKTAKAFGVTVPQNLLLRADQIID